MKQRWFSAELCWIGATVEDAEEAMSLMARGLREQGRVAGSFEAAVIAREARSPTGLPLARRKAAIPHADVEHVITPAVALCTLARPVAFSEMGNPDGQIPVELIVMLALKDHESMQEELVRLVGLLQDPDAVDRICAAPDADALLRLVEHREDPS